MEHQTAHLNRLPRVIIHSRRIDESGMWHSPCSPIQLGVETLDQCDLLRGLAVQEIPLMIAVGSHSQRLALSILVDEGNTDKVRVWDRVGIRDSERVFVDGLDGSPYVDDLIPGLEETVRFFR